MKTIKGYKFIQENMKSKNGNHTWKLGEWYKHDGKIELCKYGFHACKTPQQAFNYVYGDKFFIVEARGKIIYNNKSSEPKFVASEMRLIKELPLKRIAVRYACACARMCLKNYESKYTNDKRVSDAIKAAEDYLDKKITLEELNAAESAARSAESAAESARSAAESARSAESAAWSAAWSAAELAARSAESAAESAARSAESAAWSAAWSAESAAESARSAAESARSAAWLAINKELNKIVKEEIKRQEK